MSQFGWVDQDDRQRRAMLSVVQLFKDDGTVDELGTGSIRDGISNTLFPGTSILQTRARYLLIVPWLVKQAAAASEDGREAEERLRTLEGRAIHSLLRGGEPDGVIGRQAKEKLKRMPSAAYWAALGTFGIRTVDASTGGLLRQEVAARRHNVHAAQPDDPGAERDHVGSALHADLPPAPDDLLSEASLTLTQAEQDFLRDRIFASTSVLDECVHVLVDSEGLQDKDAATRAGRISQVVEDASTLRATRFEIDTVEGSRDAPQLAGHSVRAHFAARFGRGQSEDEQVQREGQVRTAYNSPFGRSCWPARLWARRAWSSTPTAMRLSTGTCRATLSTSSSGRVGSTAARATRCGATSC